MAHWVKVRPGELPAHPVVGGTEYTGEVLYIARGNIGHGMAPGKIRASWREAHVSFGGKEHPTREYEILCNARYERGIRWIRTSGKDQPDGAIRGGSERDGTPLYVGRALMGDGHFVPGKINFKYGKCYIPFGDKEHEITNDFYVLCQ